MTVELCGSSTSMSLVRAIEARYRGFRYLLFWKQFALGSHQRLQQWPSWIECGTTTASALLSATGCAHSSSSRSFHAIVRRGYFVYFDRRIHAFDSKNLTKLLLRSVSLCVPKETLQRWNGAGGSVVRSCRPSRLSSRPPRLGGRRACPRQTEENVDGKSQGVDRAFKGGTSTSRVSK